MEPFGLLNLLKTLLPDAQTDGQAQPALEEEKMPAPPPPPKEEQEEGNACASFLEAHERRARRKK